MKTSIALAALWSILASAQAQLVTIEPLNPSVTAGDNFSVDIVGRSFSQVLDGGGLNLSFNSSRLAVTSVTIAPIWDPAFSVPAFTIDNVAGRVSSIDFGSFGSNTGDFTIATIGLHALSAGSSSLGLTEFTDNPFASGGLPLAVTFQDGLVTIAAVPEVPSAFATSLGLLVLISMRKRRRAAEAQTSQQ